MPAQQPHHEIHGEYQQDAERQHPQRVGRVVGNDAIVDVHRKERHDQCEQVDQQRRPKHVAIDRCLFEDRAPEPVALHNLAHLGCARIKGKARPGENGNAEIAFGQLRPRQFDFTLAGFGKQQSSGIARAVPAEQHTRLVGFQQQHGGQHDIVDIGQSTAQNSARQAGPCCCTGEQGRCQAAVLERQSGGQRCPRARPSVQPREFNETSQQGVVMQQILA